MQHIIWDWNGTLFDDLPVVVDSVNASLARFGEGPIDAGTYRAHYRRPVPAFYESLLGRRIDDEMWRQIDEVFHDTYRRSLHRARVTPEAARAVGLVAGSGSTQSVLSMWWHDQLIAAVRRSGLEDHMLAVDGNRGEPGAAKAGQLDRHLRRLRDRHSRVAASRVTVIGDIDDDAEAARAVGAACVLFDSGSQPRDLLEATGAPVTGSLVEAVRIAGIAG